MAGTFATAVQAGFSDVTPLDMGGPSTDVCLCPGHPSTSVKVVAGGCPIPTPVVDAHTVGAGRGCRFVTPFDRSSGSCYNPDAS